MPGRPDGSRNHSYSVFKLITVLSITIIIFSKPGVQIYTDSAHFINYLQLISGRSRQKNEMGNARL